MRLVTQQVLAEALPIEDYYHVFRKGGHNYSPIDDMDFCLICKHSKKYHIEHGIKKEPIMQQEPKEVS